MKKRSINSNKSHHTNSINEVEEEANKKIILNTDTTIGKVKVSPIKNNIIEKFDLNLNQIKIINKCVDHNKEFEALCISCRYLICSKCTMFNNIHKYHDYKTLEEGYEYINSRIRQIREMKFMDVERIKFNLFKLQELRIKMEKDKNENMLKIESIFDNLLKDISKRKDIVIQNIKNCFDEEISKIKEREIRWETKEIIIKDLLSLQSSQLNENFLINSKNILDGLEFLSEDLSQQTFYPYININNEFIFQVSNEKSNFIRIERKINDNYIIIDKDKLSLLYDNYIGVSKGVPMEMMC